MARGTTPPAPQAPPAGEPDTQAGKPDIRLVEYEQFIDDQIRKTRTHVKAVDVFGSLIKLAAIAVAYLLVAAMVDHWLLPGGLGFAGRLALLVGLVGIASYHLVRNVLPPLVRRINPVYAADTIERNAPELKNSLVNFLFFRSQKEDVSPAVFEVIEEQAATRLSHAVQKETVDWSRVIHVLYFLLALVVVYGLYFVASPKNPFQTVSRIVLPWSDIPVPSRVSILAIDPATTTMPRGEQIEVSAEVHGVDQDEPVTLYYSTENSQTLDQPLAMHVPQGEYRYRCLLPESEQGVQQNLTYRIEAGDAISSTYRVEVTPAPTIIVESVHYEYPKYSGYSSRRAEREGDIKGLEGTRITIHARANGPIKSAYLDFDCDGRTDQPMQIDRIEAQVSFTLALADDGRRPRYASYQLWFTNEDGHVNRRPVQYRIEVVRDLPPEITLVAPEEDDVDVSLGGMLAIETFANDPDFALARVLLHGEVAGRSVFVEPLLDGQHDSQHQGQFVGRLRLRPSKYDLQVGDVVEYWAVAHDNKTPEANLTMTPRKRMRITSPEPGEPPPDQLAKDDRQEDTEGAEQDDRQPPEGGNQQQAEQGEGGTGEEQGQQGAGEVGQQADSEQEEDTEGEGVAGEGEAGDQREPSGEGGGKPGADREDASEGEGGEGERGEGEGEGERERVPSGGEDDGSAFERIQEHFNEKDKRSDGSLPRAGKEGQDRGEGEPGEEGKGQGETQNAETQNAERGEGEKQSGEPQEGEPQEGEPREGQQTDAKNKQPDKSDGESGGAAGSPKPQREPKPQDKQPDDKPGRPDGKEQSPTSPSTSQHESDARGEEGGDRAGDGREGGGQQAPREGTGSAGENQDADQGAGQSNQKGRGEATDRAGREAEADGKTGQSGGDKPGEGTGSRPAEQRGQGDQGEPGQRGETSDGTGQQRSAQDGEKNQSEKQGDRPGKASGEPSGGGTPGSGQRESVPPRGEPGGDEANLEYARKATDLVLERLEDQLDRDRLDPKLLDKLGWTKEEMERFVQRWRAMQKEARSTDEKGREARRGLDNALRSLGLRSDRIDRRSGRRTDEVRNLRDAYRGRPPAEIEEQMKAYIRGTAKVREREGK